MTLIAMVNISVENYSQDKGNAGLVFWDCERKGRLHCIANV